MDLNAISRDLQIGLTPVIISNSIEWLSLDDWQNERSALQKNIDEWRKDWESKDTNRYLKHYSKKFQTRDQNLEQFSQQKRQVNAGKEWIKAVSYTHLDVYKRQILGCTRFVLWLFDPQCRCVLIHQANETIGQIADAFLVFKRTSNDFVIDIGNIANIGHVKSGLPEPALHHVKDHQNPSMPKVAQIVNGHAAYIHTDLSGLVGNKTLLLPGQGIVDSQHFSTHEGAPRKTGA